MILYYSIVVFITQLIFIGSRTWNVKAIAKNDIPMVLLSGAIVHIAWLVSISVGVVSMSQLMMNYNHQYIPVILCSLSGGLLGSYISMKSKRM